MLNNEHPQSQQPALSNKKSRAKRGMILIFVITLGLLVSIGIVLYCLGYLTVVIKQPNQSLASVSRVCGTSVVNEYNKASRVLVSNTVSSESYVEGISKVADSVRALSKHQQDPTCLAILYKTAILKDDIAQAKAYYEQLLPLVSNNQYVDTRLDGIMSIEQMRNRVEITNSQMGSG